jgi:hypothetical protein
MLGTTILRRRGTRLAIAATITLLLALAALAAQASPAFAEGETLTVTKTGMGTVTSSPEGINCGTDCSEPYPSSTEEICIDNGPCRDVTTYQDVTLTASPDPGWAFQSWSGGCSGTATTCTVTVNQSDETVHATFIRISPPNDDFAAAQLMSGTNASVNGTTKDATRETGEPDHSSDSWSGDHTVWYSWTAPHTGDWTVDTCTAAIDSILAVYTGSQLGSLAKLKDDNNGCPNKPDGSQNFGSKLTFRATAGTTYRMVVGDAGGAMQNTFTLALNAIPAPPNDAFDNAQLMNGTSASVNGTNVSATRESSDPWGGTPNAERSVWYKWTAPFSGSATLDTCTTNYDTLLSVHTSRFFGLVNSSNNDCSSGFGSKLTFNAQNGQTFHFGVDGCCGAPAGTFTLGLNLVDDVLPQTTIHDGPQNGSVTNDTSPTFAFDSNEPDSTFKCRIYRSGLTPPAFGTCSGTGTHTESVSSGTYTFDVRATDPRGNTDDSPATRTWTVDTVAPNTPVISSPADNSLNNTGDVTLSGTAEANSTVEVFDGGASKGTATANGSGNWSKALTGVADGPHTYTARARDAAGNTSNASNARKVTVDTMGATVESWSPKGKKVKPTAKPTVTFSEKMDEATVEASANGKPTTFVLKKGRKVIPATVTDTENGSTYKAVLKPTRRLKAGAKYTATVTTAATDVAGNSVTAKSWSFTVKR